MFLPPSPNRYPANPYLPVSSAQAPPAPEVANVLSFPEGPEYQFLVGEGKYVLRESLTLARPVAHPTEPVPTHPNPLATDPRPIAGRCTFSLVSIGPRPSLMAASLTSRGASAPSAASVADTTASAGGSAALGDGEQDAGWEAEGASEFGGGGGGQDSASGISSSTPAAPTDEQDPSLLAVPSVAISSLTLSTAKESSSKRRKPRSGMINSGSTFFSRAIAHEQLGKRLSSRAPDGVFAFANIGRSCQWLDLSSLTKAEYLIKLLFSKPNCLCHDINQVSKTASHIDIILGFSTGDIIWFEPFSQRYSRINKNGLINPSPVLSIKWIPGSENLFMAAHKDGTIVIYDKERDDAPLDPADELGEGRNTGDPDAAWDLNKAMQIVKSTKSRNQKTNPVAVWNVSVQAVNAIAFAPDNKHVAFACQNNSWRMVDYQQEELLHIFHSYFGPISCVAWSPDSRYVITGGEDDLVTIWSVQSADGFTDAAALVARCQGHHSWVRAVAFDPWRCDERSYRFGSVGEDCHLCLWDFSPAMTAPVQQQAPQPQGLVGGGGFFCPHEARYHPTEPLNKVPMPPPVLNQQVDDDPLEWLGFAEEAIYVGAATGRLRVWERPDARERSSTL